MEALQMMSEPQSSADFVEYVVAVEFMRRAILNYSKRAAPLKEALAKFSRVKAAGQRKLQPQCRCYTFGDQRSRRLSKIYKQLSWSQ
jgi:hypothetical protein